MPSTYTPTDTYHTSIVVPSDGDEETAASVSSPLEALADNALYAKNRAAGLIMVQLGVLTLSTIQGWGTQNAYNTTIASGYPLAFGAITGLQANDVVDISMVATQVIDMVTINGGNVYLRLETAEGAATTTTPIASAEAVCAYFPDISGVFTASFRTSLLGQYTVAGTGVTIYVNGRLGTAVGSDSQYNLELPGPTAPGNTLTYRVWRPVS